MQTTSVIETQITAITVFTTFSGRNCPQYHSVIYKPSF